MNFGQVPHSSPIGVVGNGRVARHFLHFFAQKRVPLRHIYRRSKSERIDYQPLLDCRLILLLISDSAIESVAREIQTAKPLLHFSGSLTTPLARGVHPLMSFGPELYSLSEYQAIPFVGELNESEFRLLFPELENPYSSIAPEIKALYHALCVMGGNFTQILWTKLFEDFKEKLGIPPETAIPYLKQVTQNLADHPRDPRSTWTGPIARGDLATIERNLAALDQDPFQAIYRDFVRLVQKGVHAR